MEKEFVISEKVATALLNYLATKPYMEVAGLVQALSSMQPKETEEKPIKANKDKKD